MKAIEITHRFSNPTVEAFLDTAFADMRAEVKLNAATTGKRGLPLLKGDHMALYFENTFLVCQGLIAECNKILQFETTCFEVSEHDKLVDQQVQQLENNLHREAGAMIPLANKIAVTAKPAHRHRVLLVRCLIIVICLFDGLMSTKIFEQNGFGTLLAIAMGWIFAIVLAGAAHLAPKLIAKGKTVAKQRMIALSILAFSTLVFYAIADSRAQFLKAFFHEQGIDNYTPNPWPFVLLSLFCFAVSVGLYCIFMPTATERAAAQRYNDLLEAKRDAADRTAALTARQATLQKDKMGLRVGNSSIVIYGQMTEARIAHFARQQYSEWKNTNLLYRPDNSVPDCYVTPFPFQFTFYFTVK